MTDPFSPEGPGPRTTRTPNPGETRYVLILTLACLLVIVAILGIPWWLTR